MSDLLNDYQGAEYFIEKIDAKLRIGETSEILHNTLELKGFSTFYIITAFNPLSVVLPGSENHKRQKLLKRELSDYFTLESLSRGINGDWVEKGFCVCGIDFDHIVYLASIFGQKSIVAGAVDKKLELIEILRFYGNRSLLRSKDKKDAINLIEGWHNIKTDIETKDNFLNMYFMENSLTGKAIKNFIYYPV